jgi:hypothetical protein
MTKAVFSLSIVIAGTLIMAGNGWSFHCGAGFVGSDYTKMKVLLTCGEPTSKERLCIEHHPNTGICVNKGEIWYYNCGDNDFIYALTFDEAGILREEKNAGRGTGMSDCRGK